MPRNLQLMLWAVGLRGAVAYGLVVNLPRSDAPGETGVPAIETATLFIVVVSTLVMGSATGEGFRRCPRRGHGVERGRVGYWGRPSGSLVELGNLSSPALQLPGQGHEPPCDAPSDDRYPQPPHAPHPVQGPLLTALDLVNKDDAALHQMSLVEDGLASPMHGGPELGRFEVTIRSWTHEKFRVRSAGETLALGGCQQV